MCGIAGKIVFGPADPGGARPVTSALLDRMVATLRHRGPDDAGRHVDPSGRAGLAMSRLSIIDLATGHQPIANEDKTVWVVLNGEIYNYRSLRDGLEPRHRFVTGSDTEVLVHLYEEHGARLVDHLRGMFAFALWDAPRRRLVVARDRVGQKPLYVAHDAATKRLTFGSELKALLADPSVSRDLDPVALDEYLTYGFVPTPRSIYRDIAKLPAGCRGVFDEQGWHVKRYWSVEYGGAEPMDEPGAVDRLDELLTESVELRLISDVPLGAFLSGGLDSGIVTAIMSRLCREPVRTFTIGFADRSYDETAAARRTAAHCQTEHHEQVVDWDVQAMVPLLARHFDEPFADSSAVPTYHVCRMARDRITVALAGDGGDELFAGYRRYQACKLAQTYHRVPALLRPEWLENLFGRLPTPSAYFGTSAVKSVQYFLEFARGLRRRGWQSWLRYFDDAERAALYSPSTRDLVSDAAAGATGGVEQTADASASLAGPERMMWIDLMTYLPDDILCKVDRMSMAVGLECRSPLLDHRLVEWLATVPLDLKLRGWTRKHLLRRLADRYFPKGTFDRGKQGFMMPLAGWLRGPLGLWAFDRLVENDRFTATCSAGPVERLFDAHRRGKGDHSYRIWALLMLGEFLRST